MLQYVIQDRLAEKTIPTNFKSFLKCHEMLADGRHLNLI
jgi:hypothetical protein